MKLPNVITSIRIALSPVFLILFFLPEWTSGFSLPITIMLWVLFIIIELSDLFDGYVARRMNQVSDIGKLIDPFADVFSRMTYFMAFAFVGVMPVWILFVLFYRELSISFIRLIFLKRGITMAARWAGKLKAFAYAFSGISGMFLVSVERFGILPAKYNLFSTIALVIYITAVVASILSFLDYIKIMRAGNKDISETPKDII